MLYVQEEILRDPERIYHHKYMDGDFIISDNLAVGHEASPETQLPVSQVNLVNCNFIFFEQLPMTAQLLGKNLKDNNIRFSENLFNTFCEHFIPLRLIIQFFQVGLRIMHRVTIAGKTTPKK